MVSMPEVYFLEHQELHITHGEANKGCSSTGSLTPAPLLMTNSNLYLMAAWNSDTNAFYLALSEHSSLVWYLDEEDRLHAVDENGLDQCVCGNGRANLSLCDSCDNRSWIINRQVLMDPNGTSCAFNQSKNTIITKPCKEGQKAGETWYFASGNCFVGMQMVDTATKAWNCTVAAKTDILELKDLQYEAEVTNRTTELFQIRLSKNSCIEADWSCHYNHSGVTYHCMQVSENCTGGFSMQEGGIIRYYPEGDLRRGPYYLWGGCPDGYACHGTQVWVIGSASQATSWQLSANSIHVNPGHTAGSTFDYMAIYYEHIVTTPSGQYDLGTVDCAPAMLSMIVGPILSGDVNDVWMECANTAPASMSQTNCDFYTLSYEKKAKSLSIACPTGQVMTYLQGWFASDGHYPEEGGSIGYSCCELQLPELTRLSFGGGVPPTAPDGSHGNYTFSCEDVGVLTGLTWAEHVDDANVLCNGYHRIPIGARVILVGCSQEPDDPYTQCSQKGMMYQFQFPNYHGKNDTSSSTTYMSTCEASVSIVSNQSQSGDPQSLSLIVQNQELLTPEQLQAYSSTPTMQVVVQSDILFSCRPSPTGPVHLANVNSTLCANRVPVSPRDLRSASGVVSNLGDKSLLIQKTCPVLMSASDQPVARVVSPKGLTMESFFNILKNQVYYSVPFVSPYQWPFDFTGDSLSSANLVGFLSLSAIGEAF
ncbi:Uncharacterized protein SCF082_LOCUS44805 [Durusdinium trenchii]|uniref:Uncharacterized protein n=1 Tax=Durusdinium trenchii TaxID=1381693 RepID=A0ABP0R471_9DINO